MKKSLVILISALLVFTLIPAVLPADMPVSAAAVSEMFDGYTGEVINSRGDFENVTAEGLAGAGWTLPEGSFVTDAGDAYSGTAYIRVLAGGSVSFTAQNMTSAGYMLRGYYKHMTGTINVGSQIFMEQTGVASTTYNSPFVYTNNWTRFGIMINASQMKNPGYIKVGISNGAGCAIICLDDLELIRLDNYDAKNLVQNPGFDVNDIDASGQPQHQYASWFNSGNGRLVSDAHTGGKAMKITSGSFYTWVPLSAANSEGKKYEFSAWVKWGYGAAFAAEQISGIVAPSIGLESYEGNTVLYTKDYAFTKETGITGNGWCHVKFILDAESTPNKVTKFRLFLKSGTGGTIWDDVSIKPVETTVEIMDATGTKKVESIENGEDMSFTARAQYPAEKDGRLFIAAYMYDDNNELILTDASYTRMDKSGTTSLCKVDGVAAAADMDVTVRAYLWDEAGAPVATAEIKNEQEVPPVFVDGFEATTGWRPDNVYWEWVNAAMETENVHSGSKALKLSNYDARAHFIYDGLLPGIEYTFSFWYKGNVDSGGLVIRRYDWANTGLLTYVKNYESSRYLSEDDWTYCTYTFTQYDGTQIVIGPWIKNGTGTIYFDDMKLTRSQNAHTVRIKTDQVFYYTDLSGNGTAKIQLDPCLENEGYTADVSLEKDGVKLIKDMGLGFEDNLIIFDYDLSLMTEKTEEYRVVAEIKDKRDRIIDTVYQQVYRFDRPSTISKDGTFTDINGKRIDPVFMYHIGYDDFATAASAGINVMQYSAPSDVNETLRQLDEMYKMGVYAAVVCYWGMSPAGSVANHDRVRDYIEQIKHHPAIFGYMIMDEPFLGNSNAYEDLRKSYIMLRTADPARPTYICEPFPAYMEESAKYCDILAPDVYPGYSYASLSTFVPGMIELAHKYVNYDKPILTILQAFTQNGIKPTATELHSMMYQSLMAGGNAVGFYTWEPDNPAVDNKICDDFYWPMLQEFYAHEKQIVYDYYAYGKGTTFNYEKGNGNVWYESWYDESGENIYMVIQNRLEEEEVSATIPLVSEDGKTSITNYSASIPGYGDNSVLVDLPPERMEVKLEPCQAVLVKIALK